MNMRYGRMLLTAWAGALCCAAAWAATGNDPLQADDPRIQALATGEAQDRRKACDQLVTVGRPACTALLAAMDGDNQDLAKMAGHTLFRMVQQSMPDADRQELAAFLAGQLGEQHSLATKHHLLRCLSYIADDATVTAMYRFLGEVDLQEMTRWAVLRVPGVNGTQALVSAMQITEAQFRLSLVHGLGERGDSRSAPILRLLSQNDDPAMRKAALGALARLADGTARAVLTTALEAGEPGALALLLQHGEVLADAGMVKESLEVFRSITARASLTALEACQVAHGLSRVGIDTDAEWLMSACLDREKWGAKHARVRAACMQALALMPDDKATEVVLEQLDKTSGAEKAAWVRCLGKRAATQPDFSAKAPEAIIRGLSDTDEEVRRAAIQAAQEGKVAGAAAHLIKLLGHTSRPLSEAAEAAINHLPGQEMTGQLTRALEGDLPEATQIKVLRALGRRGDATATPVLLKTVQQGPMAVRVAAVEAVGTVGGESTVQLLLTLLTNEHAPLREAAEGALGRMSDKTVTSKLLSTYGEADAAVKPSLLRALGRHPGPEIEKLLLAEAASEREDIRAAAAEGLSRIASPQLLKPLLALAERGPAEVTAAALQGCLMLAGRYPATQREAAADLYVKIFTYAQKQEQVRQAMEGIAVTAGPEYVDMLDSLLPMMLEDNVPPEACRAAAALALQMPDDRRDAAIPTLQLAASIIPADPMTDRILQYFDKLEVKFNLVEAVAAIGTWQLAGPFPLADAGDWNKCDLQLANLDLKAPVTIAGVSKDWQAYRGKHPRGLIELNEPLGVKDHIFAYACIRFMSDEAHEVDLKVGSDDSIVAWLNGEKVLEREAARPVALDQDHAAGRIQPGENMLLLKIVNKQANWGFCARFTTLGGLPLRVMPLEP